MIVDKNVGEKWRIRVLAGGFAIAWMVVVVRLWYWQVGRGEELAAMGASQHREGVVIGEGRGEVLDREGAVLVGLRAGYDLYADLAKVEGDVSSQYGKLAEMVFDDNWLDYVSLTGDEATGEADLERSEQELEEYKLEVKEDKVRELELGIKEKLFKGDKGWVKLATGLNEEQKREIENWDLEELNFEQRGWRYYPEGSMAAHLLGFVGSGTAGDEKGYFGLEGYYNQELSSRLGKLYQERDAQGLPILIGDYQEVEGVAGADLITNIDRVVQYLVERKLKSGLERYGAKSGTVTVMDPSTGEIMAMAAFPNYDPGYFSYFPKESYANPVVAESFEPGSVLKVVVMAAAWDKGVVDEKTICPCGGPVEIGKYTIRTWNNEYHPNSSAESVIVHSDNVGMVFVAEKLGTKELVRALSEFGLGEKTGVDLQDESSPTLRPVDDWGEIDRAVAAFGQGIAVTPLQIVRAVAAIANGGELLTPRAVRELRFEDRTVLVKKEKSRRVISRRAAEAVKEMMVRAVDEGEAKWAAPRGYRIAGKTGTAQIPVAGHYDEEKTIASFVGFAPADDPAFVMLVTLREPESSPWGSETAAPLWFEIANEMLIYWGVGGR